MTTLPVVGFVTAAAALGAYLLLLWFRKERKPVLIGFHVLLGLGAAEGLVVLLHTGGIDEDSPSRRLAVVAGLCLAAAIGFGFTAPLFRRSRSTANGMLAAHVAAGVASLFTVLALAAGR